MAKATTLFDIADAGLKTEINTVRDHTKKNKQVIHDSVEETGFLRSIVSDEDGQVLCGKGVYEEAVARGAKIQFVDQDDPNVLVVVRRKGLSDREKNRAMLWDNHASDTSKNKNEEIRRLAADNPDQLLLDGIFDERDAARIMKMHADAQPLAGGGKEDKEEVQRAEVQKQSSIRMVQLFFDTDSQPVFVTRVKAIGKLFPKAKNLTDVVSQIIEKAYTEWVPTEDDNNPVTEATT